MHSFPKQIFFYTDVKKEMILIDQNKIYHVNLPNLDFLQILPIINILIF